MRCENIFRTNSTSSASTSDSTDEPIIQRGRAEPSSVGGWNKCQFVIEKMRELTRRRRTNLLRENDTSRKREKKTSKKKETTTRKEQKIKFQVLLDFFNYKKFSKKK